MKSTYCSINWGKGAVVAMLILFLALTVIALGTLNHDALSNAVGVDWGSRCPLDDPRCKRQGVDWGSLQAPCLPSNPNCGSGPVAVDWGDSFSPATSDQPPVRKVAVDWGSRAPCDPKDPFCAPVLCDPKDPECTPEPGYSVDWGS